MEWTATTEKGSPREVAYWSIFKLAVFEGGNWTYREIYWHSPDGEHIENSGWTLTMEEGKAAAIADLKSHLQYLADQL